MGITAKKLDSVQPHYFNAESIEEIKNELLEFQLTPNQIDMFFLIGKFGSKTANEKSKNQHIPRTENLTNFQNQVRKGVLPT